MRVFPQRAKCLLPGLQQRLNPRQAPHASLSNSLPSHSLTTLLNLPTHPHRSILPSPLKRRHSCQASAAVLYDCSVDKHAAGVEEDEQRRRCASDEVQHIAQVLHKHCGGAGRRVGLVLTSRRHTVHAARVETGEQCHGSATNEVQYIAQVLHKYCGGGGAGRPGQVLDGQGDYEMKMACYASSKDRSGLSNTNCAFAAGTNCILRVRACYMYPDAPHQPSPFLIASPAGANNTISTHVKQARLR